MPGLPRGGRPGTVWLAIALLGWPGAALWQADPNDHAAHHPGAATPMPPGMSMPPAGPEGADTGAVAPAAAAAGQAGCSGMGCMGGGAKPFYPALMDMPVLTPEARRFIAAEAARRLGAGAEAITTGQAPLHAALSANDPAAMQQAITGVREGVLLAESGAAALLALAEGQQPRQLALAWFKGQLGTPSAAGTDVGDGPWGLTWLHLTTMAFLIAALLGAIMIYYARLRRIDGLVRRLTPGAAPAPKPGTDAAKGPAPAAVAARPVAGAAAPTAAAAGAAPKLWSGALRVAAIFPETATVKTFRLVALDNGPMPFTFRPGQFLSFSAEADGKPIRRSYTIASAPTQQGHVEITVKREEHGAESRYLHDCVAVGDHLQVTGPSGVFTFTGEEADSIVLISGGVGITPMMCVTRYLTDLAFKGDIFFVHGARSAADVIFREELGYLEKRHSNVHVTVTIADYEDASWTGAKGQISRELIAASVPDIARRRVHVCGPPAMMDAVKAQLEALGVPRDKIKSEAFAAPPPAPAAPGAAQAAAPEAAAGTAAAPAPSAQAEVRFSRSEKSGALAPDKCVLEAAEAIGVSIDFVCRVGTCGTCVVPLTEGTVTMAVEEGLRPEDKARGIILACQAKSVGNLVVDA